MAAHDKPVPYVNSETCAQLAGITLRQLDYWNRAGVVTNSTSGKGSGSRRQWSLAQCQQIAAIAAVKTALGSLVELGLAVAIAEGKTISRMATIGARTIPVEVSIDVEAVRDAVAESWPRSLAAIA